ncbi:uncharacterized protein LOC123265903 isoform X2 [Cotesia glomerata]|uniref:uncharacterized protein LOC123265903 isoform X2 n=1 Tax=Cotesia glomerata TaxID=32391 RepID=UPI001D014F19|nr:uncharacterized protein LOC123265903 isoform X2 [Cotesia glomerata]
MSALPFTSLKFICSCCCWITCLVILIRPGGYFSSAAFVYRNPGDFSNDSAYKNTRNNNNYGSTSSESSTTSSGSSNRNSATEGVINNSRANYLLNGTKNVIITNSNNDFVVSGDPSGSRGNNNYHYYLNDDGGDRYSGKEPSKRAVSDGNDFYDENTDMSYDDDEDDDYLQTNTTEKGRFLGSVCEDTCNPDLQHVVCDATTGMCECEKLYPVKLGPTKGCAKPKKIGEQCFYRAACTFTDQHSTCTQVQHKAVCDCSEGYHKVVIGRPNKRVFCAEDLVLISTDTSTLLGIASGIAVLTGLMCFVLKLFSRARYSRPRHYANANHAPPMVFSSDTGIPLTLSGRPSSRSSQRSDSTPLSCGTFRRPSSGGSRGPLVPASRAGSRRPSLASLHSSVSSARSYSAKRLERERNEKEQRQALQELRLTRQRDSDAAQHQPAQPQQQLQLQQQTGTPSPSPRTPHSTDELLPSVQEDKEAFYNEVATTSGTSLPSTSRSKLTHQKSSGSLPLTATATSTSSSTVPSAIPGKKKLKCNSSETAFNSSVVCTTAFTNNNDTGNCSNVVDIFES